MAPVPAPAPAPQATPAQAPRAAAVLVSPSRDFVSGLGSGLKKRVHGLTVKQFV